MAVGYTPTAYADPFAQMIALASFEVIRGGLATGRRLQEGPLITSEQKAQLNMAMAGASKSVPGWPSWKLMTSSSGGLWTN